MPQRKISLGPAPSGKTADTLLGIQQLALGERQRKDKAKSDKFSNIVKMGDTLVGIGDKVGRFMQSSEALAQNKRKLLATIGLPGEEAGHYKSMVAADIAQRTSEAKKRETEVQALQLQIQQMQQDAGLPITPFAPAAPAGTAAPPTTPQVGPAPPGQQQAQATPQGVPMAPAYKENPKKKFERIIKEMEVEQAEQNTILGKLVSGGDITVEEANEQKKAFLKKIQIVRGGDWKKIGNLPEDELQPLTKQEYTPKIQNIMQAKVFAAEFNTGLDTLAKNEEIYNQLPAGVADYDDNSVEFIKVPTSAQEWKGASPMQRAYALILARDVVSTSGQQGTRDNFDSWVRSLTGGKSAKQLQAELSIPGVKFKDLFNTKLSEKVGQSGKGAILQAAEMMDLGLGQSGTAADITVGPLAPEYLTAPGNWFGGQTPLDVERYGKFEKEWLVPKFMEKDYDPAWQVTEAPGARLLGRAIPAYEQAVFDASARRQAVQNIIEGSRQQGAGPLGQIYSSPAGYGLAGVGHWGKGGTMGILDQRVPDVPGFTPPYPGREAVPYASRQDPIDPYGRTLLAERSGESGYPSFLPTGRATGVIGGTFGHPTGLEYGKEYPGVVDPKFFHSSEGFIGPESRGRVLGGSPGAAGPDAGRRTIWPLSPGMVTPPTAVTMGGGQYGAGAPGYADISPEFRTKELTRAIDYLIRGIGGPGPAVESAPAMWRYGRMDR